jgi:hypothetical protein
MTRLHRPAAFSSIVNGVAGLSFISTHGGLQGMALLGQRNSRYRGINPTCSRQQVNRAVPYAVIVSDATHESASPAAAIKSGREGRVITRTPTVRAFWCFQYTYYMTLPPVTHGNQAPNNGKPGHLSIRAPATHFPLYCQQTSTCLI